MVLDNSKGKRHAGELKFFDGDKEVGRLPIEIWDDNFVGTYKIPGYELEKGKVCS